MNGEYAKKFKTNRIFWVEIRIIHRFMLSIFPAPRLYHSSLLHRWSSWSLWPQLLRWSQVNPSDRIELEERFMEQSVLMPSVSVSEYRSYIDFLLLRFSCSEIERWRASEIEGYLLPTIVVGIWLGTWLWYSFILHGISKSLMICTWSFAISRSFFRFHQMRGASDILGSWTEIDQLKN